MALVEIQNSEEFEKYKNNLKLFAVVTKENDDYKGISSSILKLCMDNENVLFLIIDMNKCMDLPLSKTVTSTPTFIISSGNIELSRYSGTDIENIKSLVKEISDHKVIR